MMRRMNRIATAALALVAGAGLAGCPVDDLACTEIGCGPALDITLAQEAGGSIAPGRYLVDVYFGGDEADGVLDCDTATAAYGCDVIEGEEVWGELDADGALHVYVSVLPGADPPPLVTIDVASEDLEPLGSETFEPEYESTRPNGDGCPPVCYAAAGEMLVDAP